MFEIINQQEKIEVDLPKFKNFCQKTADNFTNIRGKNISIVLTTNKKIKKLNKEFRQKDYETDVLSFPNEPDEFDIEDNYLGDIIISIEQAKKQALENKLSLELEIKQLILHGILHLCGFDHETDNGEMNNLELKLRDKLGIS